MQHRSGGASIDGSDVTLAELEQILRNKRELWRAVNPGREFPGLVVEDRPLLGRLTGCAWSSTSLDLTSVAVCDANHCLGLTRGETYGAFARRAAERRGSSHRTAWCDSCSLPSPVATSHPAPYAPNVAPRAR